MEKLGLEVFSVRKFKSFFEFGISHNVKGLRVLYDAEARKFYILYFTDDNV